MTSDEIKDEVVRRALTLAEIDALELGISPLLEHERCLVEAGALHALVALAELSRE